ncbi:hypothetical protein F4824DRAFT_465203, partial [Ustulina deusta]
MASPSTRSVLDRVYLVYFLIHIPILFCKYLLDYPCYIEKNFFPLQNKRPRPEAPPAIARGSMPRLFRFMRAHLHRRVPCSNQGSHTFYPPPPHVI